MKGKSKNQGTPQNKLPRGSPPFPKYLSILFFLLAFLVYSNTLRYEYTCDDGLYTFKNTFVQKGISSFPDLVGKATLAGCTEKFSLNGYRPVVLLSFALEKSLFGIHPKTSHLINVLLYALLCAFLFNILRKLFKDYHLYVPVLITILFILHPLHTEVVSSVKSRDELLSMLFGFIALNAVYNYMPEKKTRYMIIACWAFFLSLLCKESAFSYLFLIPLLLYFFTDAPVKKIVLYTLPFVAIAGIVLGIRIRVLGSVQPDQMLTIVENSLMAAPNGADRLATNFTILFHALSLLFLPLTLSWDYSFNQFPVVNWKDATAILSLVIHLTLLIVALMGLKKKNILSFAILFYMLSFFITSNLAFKFGSTFGERFLFTPSLGFCIALPFLFGKIFKIDFLKTNFSKAKKILGALAIVAVLYAFKTIDRNTVWENDSALYLSGTETSPNSTRAHYAYATTNWDKAQVTTNANERTEFVKIALSEFQKALDIYPKYQEIYYNMGGVYFTIGDYDNAVKKYKKALELKPDDILTLSNLAVIFFNNKDYKNALTYFNIAAEINPEYANVLVGEGACYQNMKDYANAILYYEKALKLNPSNDKVIENLSASYASIGDTAKARYYNTFATHGQR